MAEISKQLKQALIRHQQGELNDSAVYKNIAKRIKTDADRAIIEKISSEELQHEMIFARYTGKKLKPSKLVVLFYSLLSTLLGYTFVIKILERKENTVQKHYDEYIKLIPELEQIIADEEEHEQQLVDMLDEERLRYVGSIVLGLNDALVELTGALAGYTLAMQNTRIIAMAGLITGVAATFSMAAAGFFSAQADGSKDALKSSIYTGVAYLFTVALLILPFLLFSQSAYIPALLVSLATALLIVAAYNAYVAVVHDKPFFKRFAQMAAVSLAVAGISFVVGIVVKEVLGIDI